LLLSESIDQTDRLFVRPLWTLVKVVITGQPFGCVNMN
jgi:hypothetical protein